MKNNFLIAAVFVMAIIAGGGLTPVTLGQTPPTTKASVPATVYKAEITDTAGTVLTGDQTTIVGKKIALKGKVSPAGGNITEQKWTIGGTRVKSYTQTTQAATAPALADADTKANAVSFYWIAEAPANAKAQVKYEATIGGKVHSATLDYEVKRPTAVLTSVTTTTQPAVGIRDSRLCFGDFVNSPGITFNASVATPAIGQGQIAFVQTANMGVYWTDSDGLKIQATCGGKFLLDRSNPNDPVQNSTTNIGGSTSEIISWEDSPGYTLLDVLKIRRNDQFHLYLMYKPSGNDSIWVTLRRLDWDWKGAATKTDGTWTVDVGSTAAPTNPGSNDSTELPVWTGRAQDVDWVYEAPTVTTIAPTSQPTNTTAAQITSLQGTNFCGVASVKFKKGGATIPATNIEIVGTTRIKCTVNLTGAATGAWDVEVSNYGDGGVTTGKLIGGFTVTP